MVVNARILPPSSAHPIIAKIRKAIGAGPEEEVRFTSSPHAREPNYPAPASPPVDVDAFDALCGLPDHALTELGLRRWGREHEDENGTNWGPVLWMFPGEWYHSIPEGYPIVDINFRRERFARGETDNDIRFGMLPYGILKA